MKFLSIKTEEGSNKYPCNAVGGPRAGEACTFPVMYPDCKLIKKNAGCKDNPGIAPMEYRGCDKKGLDNPWCATKTFHNRSLITGEWGFCSKACSEQTVRSV